MRVQRRARTRGKIPSHLFLRSHFSLFLLHRLLTTTMKKLSFLSASLLRISFSRSNNCWCGSCGVVQIHRARSAPSIISFQLDCPCSAADILQRFLTALISGEALSMAFIHHLTQTLTLCRTLESGLRLYFRATWSIWRSFITGGNVR